MVPLFGHKTCYKLFDYSHCANCYKYIQCNVLTIHLVMKLYDNRMMPIN